MKKKNYTIKLNTSPLDQEQIDKHKDFDALLKMHQNPEPPKAEAPVRRRWLYRAIAASAAACIGLVAWFGLQQNNGPSSAELQLAHFASQPYVNPPIKSVQAKFVNQDINAMKGGVYNHETGSKVIVPPAAFEDQAGRVVEGEVNIKYREFHDFVDFFLSGIPMEYDSAGIRYNLESAGMVEIYAEQNGERLNIRPGKKIDVVLVSEVWVKDKNDPINFNVYQLDTVNRNWVYTGLDRIEKIEDKASDLLAEEITSNYEQSIATLERNNEKALQELENSVKKPVAPIQPIRSNENQTSFDFNFSNTQVDVGTFASGKAQQDIEANAAAIDKLREKYDDTDWIIAAQGNDGFSISAAKNINWEDMKLRKLNNRDFELTLIGEQNEMKVIINPVLSGADYAQAMEVFNQEFAEFEKELAEREALLSSQKAALKERLAEERAFAKKSYEEKIAAYKASGKDNLASNEMIKQKIVNRFQATTFGIWNCDRPLPPYINSLKGEFVDNKESDLHQNTAFLVDKTQNTVCRFYATKGVDVLFNDNSDKMLWIVTKENKIALYKNEKFKRINKKRGNHTFVLDLVDKEIKSEEDVRKILLF